MISHVVVPEYIHGLSDVTPAINECSCSKVVDVELIFKHKEESHSRIVGIFFNDVYGTQKSKIELGTLNGY